MDNENNTNRAHDEDVEILDAIRKSYAASGEDITLPNSTQDDHGPAVTSVCAAREAMNNDPCWNTSVSFGIVKEEGTTATSTTQDSATDSGNINRSSTSFGHEILSASQPGAYAEQSGHAPDSLTQGSDDGLSFGRSDIDNEVDDVVAVANAVEEGQPSRHLDLPHAEHYDEPRSTENTSSQRGTSLFKSSTFLVACGMVVVVAGVTLLVVLLLTLPTSSDDSAGQDPIVPGSSDTPAPTLSPKSILETQFMRSFADDADTLGSLEDPGSAQSKALQWLVEDPFGETYVDSQWRVRQRFALATFYFSTDGPDWAENDGWLSYDHHECSWYSRDFFAPPNPMMKFPFVEHENPCEQASVVADMNVTSSAPQDEDTYAYKHIWLFLNSLQGEVPKELFWLTSLKSINLFKNALHGTLPSGLAQLSDLEAFSVSFNTLTGTIPAEFGKLPSLSLFSVAGNQVSGTIPTELLRIPTLETLMLDQNLFSGTVPSELGNLSQIYMLYLFRNQLTGPLPTHLGKLGQQQTLEDLYIDGNNFSGTLPSEIGLVQSLRRVGLYANSFTGTLCTDLGRLTSVLSLELQDNLISGPIPSELGSMNALNHLFLQGNRMTGKIPVELGLTSSPHSTTRSWLACNVSGNLFSDEYVEEEQCWVNSTFYELECNSIHGNTLSATCWCNCAC